MVDWWCWWLWEVCIYHFHHQTLCSSELYYVCVYYVFYQLLLLWVFTSLLEFQGLYIFVACFHHRYIYNWLGSFRYVLFAWTRNRKHTQNNTFYVLYIKSMHVMAYHHHSCLPVSLLSTTITLFYHTAIRNDFHSKGNTLEKHDFVYMLRYIMCVTCCCCHYCAKHIVLSFIRMSNYYRFFLKLSARRKK